MKPKNNYNVAQRGKQKSLKNLGKAKIYFQCYLHKILQKTAKNNKT